MPRKKKQIERREEREPAFCTSKSVKTVPFSGSGGVRFMCNIYEAEDGPYKGYYVGVMSRVTGNTKACKTIEEVVEEANREVKNKHFLQQLGIRT